LLLEGVVKSATPAMMFNQGGCSFGHSLIRFSQDSEGSLVDVARTDAVDGEVDRLITRRHDARVSSEGDRQAEEMWQESVKCYEERRQMACLEWQLHHTAQPFSLRRTLEALASHHEEQAARLAL
jgi:hypothetical protein